MMELSVSDALSIMLTDPDDFMARNAVLVQSVVDSPEALRYVLGMVGRDGATGFDVLQALAVGVALGNSMAGR